LEGGFRLAASTRKLQTDPTAGDNDIFFERGVPAASQDTRTDFQRLSFYGYHYWQVVEKLQLTVG